MRIRESVSFLRCACQKVIWYDGGVHKRRSVMGGLVHAARRSFVNDPLYEYLIRLVRPIACNAWLPHSTGQILVEGSTWMGRVYGTTRRES